MPLGVVFYRSQQNNPCIQVYRGRFWKGGDDFFYRVVYLLLPYGPAIAHTITGKMLDIKARFKFKKM